MQTWDTVTESEAALALLQQAQARKLRAVPPVGTRRGFHLLRRLRAWGPRPDEPTQCGARWHGYRCAHRAGHAGPHAARHADGELAARWGQ